MAKFSRSLAIAAAVLTLGVAAYSSAVLAAAAPGDETLGNPAAKVTVEEYASASCPHCARFNNDVFPAFKKKYIDTGKVHYVFHEFLTEPAQFAAAAFLVARCAGPGKYFTVLDTVFHQQEAIYRSNDLHGGMLKIAQAQGMTEKQFNDCISDETTLGALNARNAKAMAQDGVTGTPTFVVNGKHYEGEQTLAELDAAIAAAGK
jgi:protein-disulfide isomerase